jgi:uncharacterized membrane protein
MLFQQLAVLPTARKASQLTTVAAAESRWHLAKEERRRAALLLLLLLLLLRRRLQQQPGLQQKKSWWRPAAWLFKACGLLWASFGAWRLMTHQQAAVTGEHIHIPWACKMVAIKA